MPLSLYTHAVRILLALYFVTAAVLLILIGIYKAPVHNWTLLSIKTGGTLLVGGIALIASGWLFIWQTEASGMLRGRAFALSLTTYLLSGLIAFLLLETTVRIAVRNTARGIIVGSVAVRPTWPELLAQNRKVLAGINPLKNWDASYFVYDRQIGWTVGSNRRTSDGLYFSSVEGIRSGGPNIRMADSISPFRVALMGDSHAFSLEVPFKESWGYHLQRLLGDNVQVLNFGVDGYGIDQMYLRYQRDVRPWKPHVVVIGFSGHDFWRTMAVYPFVTFGWTGYFVKPRFVIEEGELRLLNVPLPTPDEIFTTGRIHQLPFVEYDLGYGTTDWFWRFDHSPLILRVMTSAFPRWPIANPRVSEDAMKALTLRLFSDMVQSIEQAGTVPLAVLMSSKNALVLETLSRVGVRFLDGTECVSKVPADRRNVPSGNHYTGFANSAIARCAAPAVELALRKAKDLAHRTASYSIGSVKVSSVRSN